MELNKTLLIKTLRNTSLAAIYVFGVSQLMAHGDKLFGKKDTFLTPFVVLLLFSLSAAVVGGLLFGETIYLFMDNKKKESVTAAFYSVGWLALVKLLGIIVMIMIK